MDTHQLDQIRQAAEEEIQKFGFPTLTNLRISLDAGIMLTQKLSANSEIVTAGIYLMDIKLGQAFQEKRLSEHVKMSVEYACSLLKKIEVNVQETKLILDCVACHHGMPSFPSLEAEVVANADCYRFIHPLGVLMNIGHLSKRGLANTEIIQAASAKLEEKAAILSLPCCKEELAPYIKSFREAFQKALLPIAQS